MIGTPVVELKISSKSEMEKNMAIEYVNDVTNPITTVAKIALGISVSGVKLSSAMWVAASKHENAQLGLINPTINAIAAEDHPVPLLNSTKQKMQIGNHLHAWQEQL